MASINLSRPLENLNEINMTNQEILQQNKNKTLSIGDLVELGFKDDKIINHVINKDNLLLRKIIYHSITEYAGYSLITEDNEKFSIRPNNLTTEEADYQNNLRDKKVYLEDLNRAYLAYAFEFKDNEMAEFYKSKYKKQERIIKAFEKAYQIRKNRNQK